MPHAESDAKYDRLAASLVREDARYNKMTRAFGQHIDRTAKAHAHHVAELHKITKKLRAELSKYREAGDE
jgi:hypothetical protein